jgi:rhamnose utilization protein RhaD (predicted bifunctional aldolase and dehydrogenase)/NAD(P)-dependent dehydrogenase (short-subunit alcohol dehydrogenase family)
MRSRWDEAEAARFDGEIGQRVYSSRLLGSDSSLVLSGGGNTSVKLRRLGPPDADASADVLFVKGSGYDLDSITAEGFTALRLEPLIELAELDELSDIEMARALRLAALDPDAPAASVEALLHAILPHRFVDHTHAEAVLALTNTPSGEAHIRRAYGDSVIIVPYVMPGHALGHLGAQLVARQLSEETVGLVLLHHGLVSFGASARESYERTIALVTRAEEYLAAHGADEIPTPTPAGAGGPPLGLRLAELRAQISRAAGAPMVVRHDDDPAGVSFAQRTDVAALSQSGPATPDHSIRTKRLPLLGRDVDGYAAAYREYFDAHEERGAAGEGLQMLDPAPRVVLDPELGLCTAGRSVSDAIDAAEIYRRTITLILRSSALERWQALPAAEIFDVEYWSLEQAKLKRRPKPEEFAGEIVLVTGAASGIGAACVDAFLARGACVCGLDIDPSVAALHPTPAYRGTVCDVTDETAVAGAFEQCARSFGGLDMLVLCAGIFPESRRIATLELDEWQRTFAVNTDANLVLMRAAHPFLELAPHGGRVVVVASKNVPAPGPGAAAYSASKAALTQLARVAALEWGAAGIRVNTIHPNAVFDTGIWTEEVIGARAAQYGVTPQEYRTRNVLGVEVASEDVAELVTTMCGRAFAKTTGAQVPIDGGNERVI